MKRSRLPLAVDAMLLAEFMLRDDPAWTRERIETALKKGYPYPG